jgi:hypothetical protein
VKPRGLKAVRVSIGFLTEMMTEGNITNAKCIKGLPEDADFAYWYHSPTYGRDRYGEIILVYISSEFEELKEGDFIPNMSPIFEKVGL